MVCSHSEKAINGHHVVNCAVIHVRFSVMLEKLVSLSRSNTYINLELDENKYQSRLIQILTS